MTTSPGGELGGSGQGKEVFRLQGSNDIAVVKKRAELGKAFITATVIFNTSFAKTLGSNHRVLCFIHRQRS